MKERPLDVICMGRAAVDLYSQQIGVSLENSSTFAKYVGGCAANIAIGSSRLGLKSGILSRVGDEAMGRFVRETFIQEGVDDTNLKTDREHLTALVLLGIDPPDRYPLIFYRENCADMAITEDDFSIDTFQRTKALLITGTHCSTIETFEATRAAATLAKEAGCRLILDIDYRPVLWGAAGHGEGEERYAVQSLVFERLSQLLPLCDLIVGTEEEILVAANASKIEEALNILRQHTQAMIVQKRGEKGCIVYENDLENPVTGNPFKIEVLNVIGAGDAFMSGFFRGYSRDLPVQECCNLANANGALVVTRHGCSPAMPYWPELQYFMQNPEQLDQVEKMHREQTKERSNDNTAKRAKKENSHPDHSTSSDLISVTTKS